MSVKSVFIAGAVATALAVGGVYTITNLQTVPAGYVGGPIRECKTRSLVSAAIC